MKATLLGHIAWLCTIILATLASVGCSKDDDSSTLPNEVGTPYSEYRYMVTVTDEDGRAVEGIKATLVGYNSLTSNKIVAEFTTNKSGKFESEYYSEKIATVKLIELSDIDGEQNGGEFANQNIQVLQMQTTKVKEGDGNLFLGSFDCKATVKLSSKEKDLEPVE